MSRLRTLIPGFLIATLLGGPATRCFAEEKKRYVEVTPRDHKSGETFLYLGALYVLSGLGYYLTSREKIQANASLNNYANNFGRVVLFDTDSPNANWIVHLYTGSQTYVFYRGRSYTKTSAFLLTMAQSALFEFTLEVIQEPASLEDLINTPVLGSVLGRGFELASIELLNSEFIGFRLIGRLFNLPSVFGLYEGVTLVPVIEPEKKGFELTVRF